MYRFRKIGGQLGRRTIRINGAPVLTLWGAVVAERLGYGRKTALTLGKAVAGLSAQAKGRRLGVIHEAPEDEKKRRARARAKAGVTSVEVMGRRIPVIHTQEGLRAVRDHTPEDPAQAVGADHGHDAAAVAPEMSLTGLMNTAHQVRIPLKPLVDVSKQARYTRPLPRFDDRRRADRQQAREDQP